MVEAHVALVVLIARIAVVKAFLRPSGGRLRLELEARSQNLLHQQAGGNRLEGIVHRLGHQLLAGIWLGDQVGETSPRFAWRISGCTSDDLYDLGQAGAIADCESMFAPDPVEALFGHAQRDDDIDMIAVVLLSRVFQGSRDFIALGRVIIHQIGNTQYTPIRCLHQLEARHRVSALPHTQLLDDVLHLTDLVLGALTGVYVGDVENGLFVRVEHLEDVVGVSP